jgi:hypothetical protein
VAMDRRLRCRCRALLSGVQSGEPRAQVRCSRRLRAALGARARKIVRRRSPCTLGSEARSARRRGSSCSVATTRIHRRFERVARSGACRLAGLTQRASKRIVFR